MQITNTQLKVIIGLLVISFLSNFISTKKTNDYEPDKSIFCGIKQLPQGYGRYGNRYECLKRGFGAGMNINEKKIPFRKFGLIIIVITIIILCYLYYKNNKSEEQKMKEKSE